MAKMDSTMPTLETIMQEVEHYVESEKVREALNFKHTTGDSVEL